MKVSELSYAERLLVERRRLGRTQAQRARELGVTFWTYRQAEAGLGTLLGHDPLAPLRSDRRPCLAPHEECYLRRRRAGTTRAQLAKAMGLSPYYVGLMEAGRAPVTRLAAHWGIA